MKSLTLLIAALVFGRCVMGDEVPQGQLVKSFDWKESTTHFLDGTLNATYEREKATNQIELTVNYTGTRSVGYGVADINPADSEKLASGSYAIVGEVRSEQDSPANTLALHLTFPSGTENLANRQAPIPALNASGDPFRLARSNEWQSFWIPFDTKVARPIRIGADISLSSTGTFHFRKVKLVQYLDAVNATVPPAAAAPVADNQIIVDMGRADGATTYYIAGVSYADLNAIRDMLVMNPRVSLVLRVSKEVPYNDLTQLLKTAKDAHIVRISFATPPDVAAPASNPSVDKNMYRFGWPDEFANQPHPLMEVDPNTGSLTLKYWGEKPVDLELQRVELNVLSTLETNQFAVEGHLQYSKVAPGSYLEMWTIFEPEKPGDPPLAYCTRTLAASGLLQVLAGDSEPRPFQIPFDITGAKTHLKRVLVRLHLAGGYGTTVSIDDANFSQFPNGYFPAGVASVATIAPTAPPPLASFEPNQVAAATAALQAETSFAIDPLSFALGVVMSLGVAAAASAFRILDRLWRKQKADKEMRRIASLDT